MSFKYYLENEIHKQEKQEKKSNKSKSTDQKEKNDFLLNKLSHSVFVKLNNK